MKNLIQRFFSFFSTPEIEPDPMKYLIAGLGNMGAEYDHTRHNIGFEIIDTLTKRYNVKMEHKTLGDVGQFKHKGRTFILLKPSTFMNLSGKAVNYWLQQKKILPANLLVIVDDMNIDYGSLRLKGKGSHGGHNGLKDIERILGTNKYSRLRIGIGSNFSRGRQVDFVLGKWNDKEAEQLPEILSHAADTVEAFGTIGLNHAMSQFNRK